MAKYVTRDNLILALGAGAILFNIYFLAWVPPDIFITRGAFLGIFVLLVVLLRPPKTKAGWIVTTVGTFMALGGCLYTIFAHDKLFAQYYVASSLEIYLLPFFIIGLMLVNQRVEGGGVINGLTAIMIAYVLWGQYIPGTFGHTPLSSTFTVSLFYTDISHGIFGPFLDTFVRVLSIFMIFAAFLYAGGLGDLFTAVASRLTANATGGPAKVSVISSALFGMISGSPVANVVATGSFTIPAMKKVGYQPYMAATVEAISATGGMIMPPILGAAAFLMADILGISYGRIVLAAIVPAFLWYFTCYTMVHFYALKQGIRKWDPPKNTWGTVKERGHLLFSILALFAGLYFFAAEEQGALMAVIVLFFLSLIRKSTRPNWKKLAVFVRTYVDMFAPVVILIAVLAIFISGLEGTGLQYKIGQLLLGSIQNWFLVLLITFGLCLVLGMGVTPLGTYLAAAVVAVPVLSEIGFNPLASHFFIFYASSLAPITPPVCLATFAAARLAGTSMFRTGLLASVKSLPLWIFPFVLARKDLLFTLAPVGVIALRVAILCFAVLIFVVGTEGYFLRRISRWERVLAVVTGLMIAQPLSDYLSNIFLGAGALMVVYWLISRYVLERKTVQEGETAPFAGKG